MYVLWLETYVSVLQKERLRMRTTPRCLANINLNSGNKFSWTCWSVNFPKSCVFCGLWKYARLVLGSKLVCRGCESLQLMLERKCLINFLHIFFFFGFGKAKTRHDLPNLYIRSIALVSVHTASTCFYFIYLTRKILIEIKNLLQISILVWPTYLV